MIGSLDALQKEVEMLKVELHKCQSPLVFCHNDLNHPNLIYDESNGECVSVCGREELPHPFTCGPVVMAEHEGLLTSDL